MNLCYYLKKKNPLVRMKPKSIAFGSFLSCSPEPFPSLVPFHPVYLLKQHYSSSTT